MKSAFFYMFYVISQPFFKISTLNFAHIIHEPLPSNIVRFFENFDFRVNFLKIV